VAQDDAIRGMKKGMVFSGVLMGLLQAVHALAGASWLQNFYSTNPELLITLEWLQSMRLKSGRKFPLMWRLHPSIAIATPLLIKIHL
jgi:hypothetical protein